ncbi:MAG: hypothetical protein VX424_23635 [Actinomycetota bacterium]|nr:hypothetical protein [Actinomycetota bacterium]
MADFHAADLWVAVLPETSAVGPAMEAAGKEAKSRFGSAVKDFGKTIHDDLDQIGTKAKDAFSGIGKITKDSLTSSIRDAGAEMRSALGNAFKDIPTALDTTKHAFAGLDDLAKNVGIDIGDWKQPLENADPHLTDMDNKLKDALGSVGSISSTFEGLPGKIGAAASKATLLAGEIGAVVAGLQMAEPYIDRIDQKIHDSSSFGKWFEDLPKPEDMGNWLGEHLGAKQSRKFFGNLFGYDPERGKGGAPDSGSGTSWGGFGGSNGIEPYPEHFIGPIPPGAVRAPNGVAPTGPGGAPGASSSGPGNFYKDWYSGGGADSTPTPSPSGGGGSHSSGSSFSMPKLPTPSVGSRADLRAAGGRVGNLLEFAKSLEGTPYSQALRNDCSGMVAKLANAALGLDPVASFSTVNEGQWLFSHGFEPGLGGPNDFNIGWYDHGGGNAGHTAATLPGGIHAESGGSHGSFLLGKGAAGAEDPEFTQHAHLSMGNFKASSLAGAQIPTGAEHDPLYVTSTGPGGQSGGSPFESQGQQLGQGLLSGIMQSLGLDGSVFGGKSPLDFGAVKLGAGLLNWGMKSLASGPMGSPAMSGGGGGGLLSGLAGLIPHPGPLVSAGAGPGGGSFGVKDAVAGPTIHNDNRTIVSGNTIKDNADLVQRTNWEWNSRAAGYMGGLPAPPGP